jgi:hypothetical protein
MAVRKCELLAVIFNMFVTEFISVSEYMSFVASFCLNQRILPKKTLVFHYCRTRCHVLEDRIFKGRSVEY